MADRPVDVTLLCVFFGGLALVQLYGAFLLLGLHGEYRRQPGSEEWLAWVLALGVLFLVGMALLGFLAGITLWSGERVGRTLGLVYLGLWVAETVLPALLTTYGPGALQGIETGIGVTDVVRVVVGVVLFVHLWRIDELYVSGELGRDGDTDQRAADP